MKNSLRNESMVEFITRHIDELSGKQTGTRKSKGLIEKNEDAIKRFLKGRDASELTAADMTEYTRLSEYGEALNLKLIELETLKGHLDRLQSKDAMEAECDRVARITDKRRIFKSGKKLKEDAVAVTLSSDAKLKKKPQQREVKGVTGITKVTVGIAGVTDVVGERDELLKQAVTLESILSANPKMVSLDDEISARTMLYRIKIQLEKSYSKGPKAVEKVKDSETKDPVETLETKNGSPVINENENHENRENESPVTNENENLQQAIPVGPIKNFIIIILNKLKSIFNPNSKMYKLLDKATLSLGSKQNAVLISDGDNEKKIKKVVKQIEQEEQENEVENNEKDEKKGFFKRIAGTIMKPFRTKKNDEELENEEDEKNEDDIELSDEELEEKIARDGMEWLYYYGKAVKEGQIEHSEWFDQMANRKNTEIIKTYGVETGVAPYRALMMDKSRVAQNADTLELPEVGDKRYEDFEIYINAKEVIHMAKGIRGFELRDKDGKVKSFKDIFEEYGKYDLNKRLAEIGKEFMEKDRTTGRTNDENIEDIDMSK